ncbi:hypothetical protein DOT_2203 [Desulfosporosinus sp. OT]|nr:hypothetical protein DOT_2203 [Desulfosporosinus sp. OT]
MENNTVAGELFFFSEYLKMKRKLDLCPHEETVFARVSTAEKSFKIGRCLSCALRRS